MIKILIIKDKNSVKKVKCSGHSGYEKQGKDIICSAVSAIIQTALIGLIDISEDVLYEREDGYLYFECPTPKDEKQNIRQQSILRAMYLGLKDIQSGYRAFIKMEEQ